MTKTEDGGREERRIKNRNSKAVRPQLNIDRSEKFEASEDKGKMHLILGIGRKSQPRFSWDRSQPGVTGNFTSVLGIRAQSWVFQKSIHPGTTELRIKSWT